jgi:hypothetical protein
MTEKNLHTENRVTIRTLNDDKQKERLTMPSPTRPRIVGDFSYDLPSQEAFKALLRIGGTPEDIVKWGLRWIERPLSSMSQEDWQALRAEIGALGGIVIVEPEEFEKSVQHGLAKTKGADVVMRSPTTDAARMFLERLRAGINDLLNDPSATFGPLYILLTVLRRDRLPTQRSLDQKIPRVVDQALYLFLKALHRSGGLVGRCPECAHLFLAARTNQKYCSPPCQSRVTSREYRKRNLTTSKAKNRGKRTPQKKSGSRKEMANGTKVRH